MSVLQRLPDPQPDVWLRNKSDVMWSTNWYGQGAFGACFGNFWSRRPCHVFPHRWVALELSRLPGDGGGRWARQVRRCTRCGSQIHVWIGAASPERGTT